MRMLAILVLLTGCEGAQITSTVPPPCAPSDAGTRDGAPSTIQLKGGHTYIVATTKPEPCDCSTCLDCTVDQNGDTPSGRPWFGCRIQCAPTENQTCVDCGSCVTQPGSVDCAELIRLEAVARGN